jgi:hypothetical protein
MMNSLTLSVEKSESESSVCITPTLEIVSQEKTLSQCLSSHTWRVVKAVPSGFDGFLTRIICDRCGLERTAIVNNIEESAKRSAILKERGK